MMRSRYCVAASVGIFGLALAVGGCGAGQDISRLPEGARLVGHGNPNFFTFTAPTRGFLYLYRDGELRYTWGMQAEEKVELPGTLPHYAVGMAPGNTMQLGTHYTFYFEPIGE